MGVPTGIFAAITGESISAATGAGVAVLMFLWSIRNSSDDQYVKSLNKRINELQEDLTKAQDKHLADMDELKSQVAEANLSLKIIRSSQDQIRKSLEVHSCPIAADAAVKCRLPEIISSALSP